MKKVSLLLLAALLMLLPFAAMAQTDLAALENANTTMAIMDATRAARQHSVFYSHDYGSEVFSYDCYTWRAEDGSIHEAFGYSNGDWEIFDAEGGQGIYGGEGLPYVMGFVGDAFEEYRAFLMGQNIGEFAEGQTLVSEETGADGLLTVTAEGAAEELAQYVGLDAGQKFRFVYKVDPETLIIKASDSYMIKEDGSEVLLLHLELELDVQVDVPDFKSQIQSAEEWREVHVIMDPGMAQEFDYVLEAPVNMGLAIYLPEGYALYTNAACTTPFEGTSADADGQHPATMTCYAAPYSE